MSDDSNVTPAIDSTIIELISAYLSDAIVSIARHHPEWLSEKFRDDRYIKANFQEKFTPWLAEKLSLFSDPESLNRQVIKICRHFTVPSFFLTSEFAGIMTYIGRVLYREEGVRDRETAASVESGAIALLLLDAENTNLPPNAEKILASVCAYPLQVKIAFANWRHPGLANKDAELHARGYQLLHAPEGKNGADAQMIAVGASINHYYPHAKEIFVCSADTLLIHLCNSLQNQGVTVYRVRRNKDTLETHNRYNGEIRSYSITEIRRKSFEELMRHLEEDLNELESESFQEWLVQLSNLVARLEENNPLIVNATGSDRASMVAAKSKAISSLGTSKGVDSLPSPVTINSIKTLEKFLIDTVRAMTEGQGLDYVSANHIIQQIRARYDKDINVIVKKFQPKFSLIKFLRSRPILFDTKLFDNEHRVALAKGDPEDTLPPDLTSSADLEQAIFKIIEDLTATSPDSYVPIADVAGAFHKQYGQPITKVIQESGISNKFIKFLQSRQGLQLKKDGKIYKVAIVTKGASSEE